MTNVDHNDPLCLDRKSVFIGDAGRCSRHVTVQDGQEGYRT